MILDASALLAFLQGEKGADVVQAVMSRALISSVNWAEVIQKMSVFDESVAEIRPDLEVMGLKVIPFTVEQADICASLWQMSKPYGLSFADRACIATGIQRKTDVLTADRVWQSLVLPVEIKTIR